MGDRIDSTLRKSRELCASVHELYQEDGAQLLLEKPSRAVLLGVYGLFSGLLVALVSAWLIRTDIAIRVQGELRPSGPVHAVAPPLDGELVNLYVTEGMPVKQGDIIARVRSLKLLSQTVKDLNARIQLMEAEKAYALIRQTGPVAALEDNRAAGEAKLRLDLARLRVMAGAVNPDHIDAEGALRLFSPIDGFVLETLDGDPQTRVAAHQILAKITANRNLAFHLEIPQRDRRRAHVGLPVVIRLDASAGVLHGVLAYLAPIPKPSASRGEPVYVGRVEIREKDKGHGLLHPGMRGRAEILLKKPRWIDLIF